MKRLLNITCTVGVAALVPLVFALSGAEAKSSTPPPKAVADAPVCDNSSRPKITKVAPDSVKPGDKIVIKGENFGTKECFHNVSFGSVGAGQFKYLNKTTVEATVPNLKPGLMPVNILTGAGSSQFVILVQSK